MIAADRTAPSGARLSDRAKIILSALLVTILVALLFLLAEGAVRMRQYLKYGHTSGLNDLYQKDGSGLRVPRAGASIGPIRINGLGFRGPELSAAKPEGVVRVAFLGASTTFCAEVSSDEVTWPHLVTESLRREFPQAKIDYVNGGVPGYSVAASILNFERRVAPLDPDLVVIYHGTNNLSGELRRLASSQGAAAADLAPPGTSWLSRHSLLWDLVTKNLRMRSAQQAAEANTGKAVEFDPEALGAEFREELTGLVRSVKSSGAVVALATFSTHMRAAQNDDARRGAMASAVLYMPGVDFERLLGAYRRYNDIIREVAESEGAILIPGEEQIPGDPRHFVDSVHFSDAGSRAQALRVFQALRESAEVGTVFATTASRNP
jgi:lysophospholipase L1-like esterase